MNTNTLPQKSALTQMLEEASLFASIKNGFNEKNALHDVYETHNKKFKQSDFVRTTLPFNNNVPIRLGIKSYRIPVCQTESQGLATKNLTESLSKINTERYTEMRTYKCSQVMVPMYSKKVGPFTSIELATSICPILYPFYAKSEVINIPEMSDEDYYRSYISFMKLIETTDNLDEYNKPLKSKMKEMVPVLCDNLQDYISNYTNIYENLPEFMNWVGELTQQKGSIVVFVLLGLAMLTMSRSPNGKYYVKYQENRIRAMCGMLGINTDEDFLAALNERCLTIVGGTCGYLAMSSSFEFRKVIFLKYIKLVKNHDDSPFYKLMKHIIMMLAYTEMSHVLLIDKYLVSKHKEFIGQFTLNIESELIEMYKFLEKYGQGAPYIKLMVPAEECNPISRRVLSNATTFSQLLAVKFDQSMRYYVIPENKYVDYCRPFVDRYYELNRKMILPKLVTNPHAGNHGLNEFLMLAEALKTEFEDELNELPDNSVRD